MKRFSAFFFLLVLALPNIKVMAIAHYCHGSPVLLCLFQSNSCCNTEDDNPSSHSSTSVLSDQTPTSCCQNVVVSIDFENNVFAVAKTTTLFSSELTFRHSPFLEYGLLKEKIIKVYSYEHSPPDKKSGRILLDFLQSYLI